MGSGGQFEGSRRIVTEPALGYRRKHPNARICGRCWRRSRHRRPAADPTLVYGYTTQPKDGRPCALRRPPWSAFDDAGPFLKGGAHAVRYRLGVPGLGVDEDDDAFRRRHHVAVLEHPFPDGDGGVAQAQHARDGRHVTAVTPRLRRRAVRTNRPIPSCRPAVIKPFASGRPADYIW